MPHAASDCNTSDYGLNMMIVIRHGHKMAAMRQKAAKSDGEVDPLPQINRVAVNPAALFALEWQRAFNPVSPFIDRNVGQVGFVGDGGHRLAMPDEAYVRRDGGLHLERGSRV